MHRLEIKGSHNSPIIRLDGNDLQCRSIHFSAAVDEAPIVNLELIIDEYDIDWNPGDHDLIVNKTGDELADTRPTCPHEIYYKGKQR